MFFCIFNNIPALIFLLSISRAAIEDVTCKSPDRIDKMVRGRCDGRCEIAVSSECDLANVFLFFPFPLFYFFDFCSRLKSFRDRSTTHLCPKNNIVNAVAESKKRKTNGLEKRKIAFSVTKPLSLTIPIASRPKRIRIRRPDLEKKI